VLPLEFVVMGTPISAQGSGEAKRLWTKRIRSAADEVLNSADQLSNDNLVLRIAYFYMDAPAADLDNIVKPIQDALKGIAFADDVQVVDLIASMRPKAGNDRIEMSANLSRGFAGHSDFVHVVVDYSSRIEVFR
jgi:crossover junction endodeoxyribonuclease RusA